jgi:hypothetical protein
MRENVYKHTERTAPCDSFGKVPAEWARDRKREVWRDGEKIEWKTSEVNTRAVSRGHNDLIGEFKMAAGYEISIREYVMEYTYISTVIDIVAWSTRTFKQ